MFVLCAINGLRVFNQGSIRLRPVAVINAILGRCLPVAVIPVIFGGRVCHHSSLQSRHVGGSQLHAVIFPVDLSRYRIRQIADLRHFKVFARRQQLWLLGCTVYAPGR